MGDGSGAGQVGRMSEHLYGLRRCEGLFFLWRHDHVHDRVLLLARAAQLPARRLDLHRHLVCECVLDQAECSVASFVHGPLQLRLRLRSSDLHQRLPPICSAATASRSILSAVLLLTSNPAVHRFPHHLFIRVAFGFFLEYLGTDRFMPGGCGLGVACNLGRHLLRRGVRLELGRVWP